MVSLPRVKMSLIQSLQMTIRKNHMEKEHCNHAKDAQCTKNETRKENVKLRNAKMTKSMFEMARSRVTVSRLHARRLKILYLTKMSIVVSQEVVIEDSRPRQWMTKNALSGTIS